MLSGHRSDKFNRGASWSSRRSLSCTEYDLYDLRPLPASVHLLRGTSRSRGCCACPQAAKKGRAGLPQALLQELLVVMVRWKPPEQAQAHLVLQAVLGAEGGSLREPQAHALLSSFWHQVALACLVHRLGCSFSYSGCCREGGSRPCACSCRPCLRPSATASTQQTRHAVSI